MNYPPKKHARKRLFTALWKGLLLALVMLAIVGMMEQGDWWQALAVLIFMALVIVLPWIFPPKSDRPRIR